MSIKTLQELANLNPPRETKPKKVKDIKVVDHKEIKPLRKTRVKLLSYYEVKLLFGLINFKITPVFK